MTYPDVAVSGNKDLYRKISIRVATPLILLYLVAFLDRVNVSFAKLTMNHDLGISDTVFGVAAGIFFLGYMLFAVPSNVMLKRFGPRYWMAFLMITWGLLSGSMAFVHTSLVYILVRFLIGAAEAGFFPGIVFYLTQWLPSSARAGVMALFMVSIPLSSIVGSPISAKIMQLGGSHGLAGWQWLFVLEAAPAVILGCLVPLILTASPAEARWLTEQEKTSLANAMTEDHAASMAKAPVAHHEPIPYGIVMPTAATYFCYTIGLYALGFWVPSVLSSHGVKLASLGWLTALPFVAGAIGMVVWSRASDKSGAHRQNHLITMLLAGVGFALTALAPSLWLVLLGLALAAVGVFASLPIFWAGFSGRISMVHAAVGIAIVNSLGNIGGFVGPYGIGWLLQRTHSYVSGLLATAAALAFGAMLGYFTTARTTKA